VQVCGRIIIFENGGIQKYTFSGGFDVAQKVSNCIGVMGGEA
jgi:hypothetical protein